jgi:hypothetical protein
VPRRAQSLIALVFAASLAAAVGGCSSGGAILDDIKEGKYFNKPVIQTPSWAKFGGQEKTAELGPRGPVSPEDLVNAAGECAQEVQAAKPAAAPETAAAQPEPQPEPAPAGKAQFGSLAGDLASAPMPHGPPPAPPPKRVASANPGEGLGGLQPEGFPSAPVLGGVALGMTECQAVRRAGRPNQVTIGAAERGERKVVVTYLSGPWPGIYTFQSGRLKVVDALPEQPKPAKPNKKKQRAPAHTAGSDRVSVR